MLTGLKAVVAAQAGLFARHQALTAGYTRKEFDWMTRRGGPWRRVRYGVYIEREQWDRLDPAAQARLLDRAGLLACDDGTLLSHSSAARVHRLPLYAPPDGLIHVTRLRYHDRVLSRIVAGIKHHAGQLAAEDLAEVEGVPVTSRVRTMLDVTSEFGYFSGLVIGDALLRAGVGREELQAAVDRQPHDPHVSKRRAVVAEADGRAETPIESLGRHLVRSMGICDVIPQQTFEFLDAPKAAVDLYSPGLRHVFECDGKLKYQDQVDRRGDLVTAQDVVWREKQREDRLRGRGLGVSRLGWSDVQPDAFERVSARLWREIRAQNAAGLFTSEDRSA